VTLYDDKIETPDGACVLSPEVRADADSAGNLAVSSRVTATRLVTLGVFAFAFKKKKKHDTRELYLAVETPEFMCVRQVDPNMGASAKQFAAKIVNAGKQASHVIEQRQEDIAEARQDLKRVESDRFSFTAGTSTATTGAWPSPTTRPAPPVGESRECVAGGVNHARRCHLRCPL
jgi:hypothetical protein